MNEWERDPALNRKMWFFSITWIGSLAMLIMGAGVMVIAHFKGQYFNPLWIWIAVAPFFIGFIIALPMLKYHKDKK